MYLLGLIEKMADGLIVVKRIDYIRNVLAHINLGVPLSLKKLWSSVYKICGEDSGEYTVSIRLVDSLVSVAEKTKGGEYKDSLSALILELLRNIKYGLARGNHIVYDNNVLAFNISAKVLVRNDGVLAVNDYRIITALVEHTEIDAKN